MWKRIEDVQSKLKDTTYDSHVVTDGISSRLVSICNGEFIDYDGEPITWATHIMKLPKLDF